MLYRTPGSTGLSLARIGVRASPLSDVFGTTDAAEGIRAVHEAVDRGINFFDASPYYGITLAEERLGQALRDIRAKAILATKWDGMESLQSISSSSSGVASLQDGGDAPEIRMPILDGGTIEGDPLTFQVRTEDGRIAYFSLRVHGNTIGGEEKIRGAEKNAKYQEKDGFKHVRTALHHVNGTPNSAN